MARWCSLATVAVCFLLSCSAQAEDGAGMQDPLVRVGPRAEPAQAAVPLRVPARPPKNKWAKHRNAKQKKTRKHARPGVPAPPQTGDSVPMKGERQTRSEEHVRPSMPVAAPEGDSIQMKDIAANRDESRNRAGPGVPAPVVPSVGMEEPSARVRETPLPKPLKERRRTATRWIPPSLGLFQSRLRTREKVFLAVFAIVGMIASLHRRVWGCLAGAGASGSLFGSGENECKQFLGLVAESEGGGDAAFGSEGLRVMVALGLSERASRIVLSVLVPLAVTAITVAFILTSSPGKSGTPSGKAFEDNGRAGNDGFFWEGEAENGFLAEGEQDNNFLAEEPEYDGSVPVEVTDDEVVVGNGWKDEDGDLKQGTSKPITFFRMQKRYRVYLSRDTEAVLQKEGLLDKVRAMLRRPPRRGMQTGKFIWGVRGVDSVLAYKGTLTDVSPEVLYEVHLPRGAFGINTNIQYDNRPDDVTLAARAAGAFGTGSEHKEQAYVDLLDQIVAVAHVTRTGEAPPPGSWRDWQFAYDESPETA